MPIDDVCLENCLGEVMYLLLKKWKNKICPDQRVGRLYVKNGIVDFRELKRININKVPSQTNKMFFILESPHTEEFIRPYGPAKGNTYQFFKNKCSVAIKSKKLSLNPQYDVIFINAIQYQCSLGFDTDIFRDLVFLHLWVNGGRKDFQDRIASYQFGKNDVIFNCCSIKGHAKTKDYLEFNRFSKENLSSFLGLEKDDTPIMSLKLLVKEAIKEKYPLLTIHDLPHPVSWNTNGFK